MANNDQPSQLESNRLDQRGIAHFLLLVFMLALIGGVGYFVWQRTKSKNTPSKDASAQQILIEEVPKSPFHSPDGSWWGYNMQKVTRIGEHVFMYVVENKDSSNKTSSKLTIYKKSSAGNWQSGAGFTTSRPGNILADSEGVLHAFVFEPYEVETNDSWGKLKHYWFPGAAQGDIKTFKQETVIENNGTQETVNIRVGVAIAPDDTMAIAFGLTENIPPNMGHSEHLYIKKPSQKQWQHLVAGQRLGHDFYYPFVFATNKSFHLLPVQDDYYAPDPSRYNVYQKILYLEYANEKWNKKLIVDLSNHRLAKERLRLLEQSDLWVDSNGDIHAIYKEFTNPKKDWKTERLRHAIYRSGKWSTSTIEANADWVRLVEYKKRLFYIFLGGHDRSLLIKPVSGDGELKIHLPDKLKGAYPYIATLKSGTIFDKYLDIILHASDPNSYGESSSYYVRVDLSELGDL